MLKPISEMDICYSSIIGELDLVHMVMFRIANMCSMDISDYLSQNDFVNRKRFEELVRNASFPKKNILDVRPDLEKEWHPLKNGGLSPKSFSYGSQKKAWWVCEHGHEYESVIASRVKGHGCKLCHLDKEITEETRKKMSDARKGKKREEKTKNKLKDSWSLERHLELKNRKRINGKFCK